MRELKTLPFVSNEGDQINFWNVKATGNWSADNQVGRAHGEACVRYMREHENPAVLFSIVEAMTRESKVLGGIECGFFQMIAERAGSG